MTRTVIVMASLLLSAFFVGQSKPAEVVVRVEMPEAVEQVVEAPVETVVKEIIPEIVEKVITERTVTEVPVITEIPVIVEVPVIVEIPAVEPDPEPEDPEEPPEEPAGESDSIVSVCYSLAEPYRDGMFTYTFDGYIMTATLYYYYDAPPVEQKYDIFGLAVGNYDQGPLPVNPIPSAHLDGGILYLELVGGPQDSKTIDLLPRGE